LGKIEAKVIRFEQIRLNLGKIKILHPQEHSISYVYGLSIWVLLWFHLTTNNNTFIRQAYSL